VENAWTHLCLLEVSENVIQFTDFILEYVNVCVKTCSNVDVCVKPSSNVNICVKTYTHVYVLVKTCTNGNVLM